MKKFLNSLLIGCLITAIAGCALFRNPEKSWDKTVAKVEAVNKNIDKNDKEIINQGRGYVFGTKLALAADPSTNRFHEVATVLNDKAVETLGNPNMEEANALRIMVANLISTNKDIIAKGEKQLSILDSKLIDLQKENIELKNSLIKAENKVIEVGTINAGYASKWTTMIKIAWYFLYAIIAAFVIKLLSVILPPPYNSIGSIIYIPFGIVIKVIKSFVPEAVTTAGLVAQSTYSNTKLALSHVVEAIQEHKRNNPEAGEKLGGYLKDITSKEITRPIISKIKQELGY